ncbi:hypothetical protein GUITHDRAFT_112252 [Guillardia theta CCMP2712]|uniref:Uncharacterized protein n=1 Tax=Guillardia theta (strain CCMP2712) TaxID=905079 RepID=L1J177_GUITC|nr:hypothetical protein GUITHDRAFT_112252 [Guillardia theta CCMP2712]EKX41835.1 hypothetical protein GUITHDRAFT_112252 [Guillardia theta CCMP2712]|eukprot:XP_005828815.1 hypothetical protein GUITHDRAFT_112252 [Guillardia theta CCMP2712]
MSLQRFDDAISIFHSSKNIATSCGYVAQAQFVDGLISEAQSKAQSGQNGIRSNSIQQLSLESRDDDHIQRTFARSFVEKELIVLVLNDQKETSDNAFSTEIMKALKSLSIACEFLNVRNNESLINAFKKVLFCSFIFFCLQVFSTLFTNLFWKVAGRTRGRGGTLKEGEAKGSNNVCFA